MDEFHQTEKQEFEAEKRDMEEAIDLGSRYIRVQKQEHTEANRRLKEAEKKTASLKEEKQAMRQAIEDLQNKETLCSQPRNLIQP